MKNVLRIALLFGVSALPAADSARLPGWRERMARITPHSYVARHTGSPPAIDGRLDDPAWDTAPWTEDFADIEGNVKPKPRFRTRAKILWDDTFLYVAAELEEPHVWGKLTQHDAVIFHDPDFEVFLDPDGDTHAYYEFELNALNTGWDLFLPTPYMDGGKARNEWGISGLRTAVQVRGTLNDPRDTDTGWTLEMAFPWTAFVPPGTLAGVASRAPADGDVWRLNFSRVEWQITTAGDRYEKVPGKPEDNWVWSPQGVVDMHRPEMWGRVLFTKKPAPAPVEVPSVLGREARALALDFYYAQLDFRRANQRWAATLAELGWSAPAGPAPPRFQLTTAGYEFSVPFRSAARERRWTIRQDRRLTIE